MRNPMGDTTNLRSIASLSVRYRLSRVKIQEFLWDWAGVELSIGSIDRSIHEAGLACRPVVEALIKELQEMVMGRIVGMTNVSAV